jgi:hypothetical protein
MVRLGQATQNGVQALRYADDLLVLARDLRLARQAILFVQQTLGRLQQRLRDGFPQPCSIQDGVTWLGVRLQARPNRWTGKMRFGYFIPDDKVVSMLARVNEMTMPPSTRIDASAFNLGRWIVSVNEQLRDWHQAYVFADNAADVFRTLDEHTRDRVGQLLNSVTGTRWRDLYGEYRLRLPRGFWTWQVSGCHLTVLSALAPRCPYRLTRRPPWQYLVRDDEPAALERKPDEAKQLRLAPPNPLPSPDAGQAKVPDESADADGP